MPNADITEAKKAVRSELLSRFTGISPEEKAGLDKKLLQQLQELPELQNAGHIFSFISVDHETDTHDLIDWLVRQGKQVSIPKISNGTMVPTRFPGWDKLAAGQFGIPEPQASETIQAHLDVCITPGAGFSITGDRLGRGHGYYDRWFSDNSAVLKIAPAYEFQIVDDLPVDSHDVRVDLIVTEDRMIRP